MDLAFLSFGRPHVHSSVLAEPGPAGTLPRLFRPGGDTGRVNVSYWNTDASFTVGRGDRELKARAWQAAGSPRERALGHSSFASGKRMCAPVRDLPAQAPLTCESGDQRRPAETSGLSVRAPAFKLSAAHQGLASVIARLDLL